MPWAAKQHGAERRKRKNSHQRGYTPQWEKFRRWFLNRHPFCADCEQYNLFPKVEKALEVHHIKRLRDRPDLKYVEANCLGLCHSCHSKRSAKGE